MNSTGAFQSRRVWIGGGLAIALILVAASWLLAIHPKLASAQDTRSQADDAITQNMLLAARNSKLASQQRQLASLQSKLTAAIDGLPPVQALPEFTHEITSIASTQSVTLNSIVIGTPTPVTPAVAATPSTNSASSETSGTPNAATPAASAAASQYQIAVTLTSKGTLAHQLAFTRAVRNGERRALVISSQIASAPTGATVTVTTQLSVFLAPMSADQLAKVKRLLAATN